MKQTFVFETRFGVLTIETTCEIDMSQIEEIREQLELCSTGKSSAYRLNEGIDGSSTYIEDEFRGYTFKFESASRVYPSHWMDNLFKIVYQILTTNN